jgi:hypothetical protein
VSENGRDISKIPLVLSVKTWFETVKHGTLFSDTIQRQQIGEID